MQSVISLFSNSKNQYLDRFSKFVFQTRSDPTKDLHNKEEKGVEIIFQR